MVVAPESLPVLNAKKVRELARDLIAQIASRDRQIAGFDEQIRLGYKNYYDDATEFLTMLEEAAQRMWSMLPPYRR